jgi:hypothetical protein
MSEAQIGSQTMHCNNAEQIGQHELIQELQGSSQDHQFKEHVVG